MRTGIVIAAGGSDIRVAFSCIEKSDIAPLFDAMFQCANDLNLRSPEPSPWYVNVRWEKTCFPAQFGEKGRIGKKNYRAENARQRRSFHKVVLYGSPKTFKLLPAEASSTARWVPSRTVTIVTYRARSQRRPAGDFLCQTRRLFSLTPTASAAALNEYFSSTTNRTAPQGRKKLA